MSSFGYQILSTPITDIDPDSQVLPNIWHSRVSVRFYLGCVCFLLMR